MRKNRTVKSHFFLALLLCVSACFSNNQTNQNDAAPTVETNFDVPKVDINLAAPLEVSTAPTDVARCEQINRTIDQSEFNNARWGVFAFSLKTKQVICERDSRKLFNPASVHKILTSVVALDKLGADFRWQTKVFSNTQIADGILSGDLILYGHGAPDFDAAGLGNLIVQLKAKNIKKITGNIVGDESFFRGDNLGDGWTWNDAQWYYGAEASALSIDRNLTEIKMQNGKVVAENELVPVAADIKPVEDYEAYGIKRDLGDDEVYVWGSVNHFEAKVSVGKPALTAAKMFREALQKNGIAVEGEAKSANWKSDDKIDETKAVELASFNSQTLGEIVRRMNKDSVNIYAELILRTLGKRFGDSAPDEIRAVNKMRGDDAAGASVVKKWLTENNVATDEIKIHDGSGLSRLDFVTPEAIGRALVFAAQSKFSETFKNSLPAAGTDGTLRGRMGNLRGKVLAKTGSIMYVNALAGYAKNANDETFAFVVICNNQTRKENSSVVLDAVAGKLTE